MNPDKYEGHTPARWASNVVNGLDLENETHAIVSLYDDPRLRTGGDIDMKLIAAAPELLAEVKRLQVNQRHLLAEVKRLREEVKDYYACLQNLWDKELIPEDTDSWDEVKELLEVD